MNHPVASTPIVAVDPKTQEVRRYQTHERLGEGGSGEVYAAVRLPDGQDVAADDARRVAIKLSYTLKWKGHLADEARLLHQLQQFAEGETTWRPVRIRSGPEPLEVASPGGTAALIELEYLDGVTLRAWLNEWKATPHPPEEVVDEVLTTARQLAEALVQLQTNAGGPLIHRDLKPENLMRTSRGLRVFDFNVARPDETGAKTSYVGTEQYRAPEVLFGGDYDKRADLFSVGVILWEMVHRRTFERHLHTKTVNGDLRLVWPTETVKDWPPSERKVVDTLLPDLLCGALHRVRSGEALLQLVEALEAPRREARKATDPLAHLDMIQVLAELRPSGLAAVVSDATGQMDQQSLQDFLRDRMQVDDPLESWLVHEVSEAATTDPDLPTLFVLSGNAGDGKSHLLARLRRRLAGRREVLDRLRIITDATHALQPDASQMNRLEEFFRPFADTEPVPTDRVHLIAINTGMVIKFFEHPLGARYSRLYERLQHHLGLVSGAPTTDDPWRVEVVNLDLRDLLSDGAGESFAERMLDRLDPGNADGIAGRKWSTCKVCSALALCPVAFNLRALQMPSVRSAVLQTLRRVSLDTDVHLSPRNLWGFLYRLVTGGIERYDERIRPGEAPCDLVRRRVDVGGPADGQWLLEGHFSELMFQQPGAGAPWSGLVRHDPAFSPVLDMHHTRMSIKTELDNDPVVIAELGGQDRSLAGLALDALTSKLPESGFRGRRRDAAVRRQVLFHSATFDRWVAADGGREFEVLLDAYGDFSRNAGEGARLKPESRQQLKQLRALVQDVFLKGNGREIDGHAYLRVSQPNVRARTELLVRADRSALDEPFDLKRMVVQDLHVVAHRGRERLLELLGYRPNQVTLRILGVRVTVDLELFEFLRRVDAGLKPSMRDLSQFQALLFIGERVGNHLAQAQRTRELFVYNADDGSLFRLATDDFGTPHLEPAR